MARATQTLKCYIANMQHSQDDVAKMQAVGSAVGVWLVSLPLLLTCGSILTWWSPILAGAQPNDYSLVRITSAILVLTFILAGLLEIPAAVLRGMNMEFRRLGLIAGTTLGGGIATYLLVANGAGLPSVAMVRLGVAILSAAGIYYFVRANVAWFGIRWPGREGLVKFTKLTAWFFVWIFAFKLLMESDLVLLATVGSPDAVTAYALTGMGATSLTSILRIIVAATSPGLGGIIGSGDLTRANRVRDEGILICWGFVTVAGVLLVALNAAFVRLWVGSQYYAGWQVNLLLVAIMAQFALLYFDGLIIDVTLELRMKVIFIFDFGNTRNCSGCHPHSVLRNGRPVRRVACWPTAANDCLPADCRQHSRQTPRPDRNHLAASHRCDTAFARRGASIWPFGLNFQLAPTRLGMGKPSRHVRWGPSWFLD